MIRNGLLAITIALFSIFSTVAVAGEIYHEVIKVSSASPKRFYKVDDNVYRSAQPDKDDMKELEQLGIKSVLNLRSKVSDEKFVGDTGLKLNWVKMKASKINDDDIIEALKVINNAKSGADTSPILIHCKKGSDRTGVVVAMYRVVFYDWSKDKAIKEMLMPQYDHSNIIYNNIAQYIKNVDVDKIKSEVFNSVD